MGSWYQTGDDGISRTKEIAAEQRRRAEDAGPQRFYLMYSTSTKFTCLDSPWFFCFEHNVSIGRVRRYVTCIQDVEACPLCDSGNSASRICAMSIIDHSKWIDRNGITHVNEKKLLVTRGKALEKILLQFEKRGGNLELCTFEASRGSHKNECNTGEDFEFLGRVTAERIGSAKNMVPDGIPIGDFLTPFDYQKLFQPLTSSEMRKLVGAPDPIGSSAQDGEGIHPDAGPSVEDSIDSLF